MTQTVLRRHISTTAQASLTNRRAHVSRRILSRIAKRKKTYAYNARKEALEFCACLLVDAARDALDTATARKTANVRLGDALDIVPQDFSMRESACCFPSLLGRISYLCRFALPTLPEPRPLPATPRPPIPPIDVFPPIVFPPPGRPGAMFVACYDLYVLVLICFDVLEVLLERLDQKPAEERGHI